jgi:hypothetical protein
MFYKMMNARIYFQPFYGPEGEGGEGGDGGTGEGGGGAGEGGGGAAGAQWDGKFTDEQQKAIDGIISKRFAKEKDEKTKLLGQLNSLKETAQLTKEERDKLQGQIDELENSMLSKDEQTAKAKAELEKRHQKELTKATEEGSLWKTRFTDSIIDRAWTDAAVEHGAESPRQLRMMFRGSTRLVEDADEETGKTLGTFTPHVKFVGLNDEKEEVELEMPVAEAVKKIKADGLNSNLFKHGATGGTGKPPAGGQGKGTGDPNAMPTPDQYASTEEYAKAYQQWRDTHNLDGSKRKSTTSFAGT